MKNVNTDHGDSVIGLLYVVFFSYTQSYRRDILNVLNRTNAIAVYNMYIPVVCIR